MRDGEMRLIQKLQRRCVNLNRENGLPIDNCVILRSCFMDRIKSLRWKGSRGIGKQLILLYSRCCSLRTLNNRIFR